AVTAMQYEISDPAAVAFARGFYTAIARGRGVDDAVSSGRVSILGLSDRTLEWVTPVLYLRGRETLLFTLPAPAGTAGTAVPGAARAGRTFPQAEASPGPPVGAGTRPHQDPTLATASPATADAPPPVTETAPAPANLAAGQAAGGPDVGLAAATDDGGHR